MVSAGEYPELRLKAWATRVMTGYLAVAIEDVSRQFSDAERPSQLAMATVATRKIAEWQLLLENTPRYMTQERADQLMALAWELLGLELYVFFFMQTIS